MRKLRSAIVGSLAACVILAGVPGHRVWAQGNTPAVSSKDQKAEKRREDRRKKAEQEADRYREMVTKRRNDAMLETSARSQRALTVSLIGESVGRLAAAVHYLAGWDARLRPPWPWGGNEDKPKLESMRAELRGIMDRLYLCARCAPVPGEHVADHTELCYMVRNLRAPYNDNFCDYEKILRMIIAELEADRDEAVADLKASGFRCAACSMTRSEYKRKRRYEEFHEGTPDHWSFEVHIERVGKVPLTEADYWLKANEYNMAIEPLKKRLEDILKAKEVVRVETYALPFLFKRWNRHLNDEAAARVSGYLVEKAYWEELLESRLADIFWIQVNELMPSGSYFARGDPVLIALLKTEAESLWADAQTIQHTIEQMIAGFKPECQTREQAAENELAQLKATIEGIIVDPHPYYVTFTFWTGVDPKVFYWRALCQKAFTVTGPAFPDHLDEVKYRSSVNRGMNW